MPPAMARIFHSCRSLPECAQTRALVWESGSSLRVQPYACRTACSSVSVHTGMHSSCGAAVSMLRLYNMQYAHQAKHFCLHFLFVAVEVTRRSDVND